MDLVVGLGVPMLDLTVPLVQLASSIAITAAVTRAEPRRVGRMTAVCHRLAPTGVHSCRRDGRSRGLAGDVSGFAPPGDIHRMTNTGDVTAISIHVYGTDVNRIGSSVRRYY